MRRGLSNLRMTWLSNGLIWPQYTGTRGPDDQTKVGERFGEAFYYIFGAPQLSLGPVAGEFSYNPRLLGEIHTVSYPGAFIRLGITNKIDKRIALKNAL